MSIGDFEKIYKQYEKELKAFIYTIARQDIHIAEDILQNTMINAYRYIHTLKDENKLKSWLYQIARSEATRYFKAGMIDIAIPHDNIEEAPSNNDILTENDIIDDIVSTSEFIRLIGKLSSNEQTVLLLRYQYGYKLTEIAKMQNENKNTIKILHYRAMRKLKTIIEKEAKHD